MNIFKATLLVMAVVSSSATFASHGNHNHSEKTASQPKQVIPKSANTLSIQVQGMVCDFCARGIEKMFSKEKSVEAVSVNLENKKVTVALKPGQTLSDDVIKKVITANGVSVVSISR